MPNFTTKKPFFSVIIPTRNRPSLLKRAIYSVINQTFKEFELIVVDDASRGNIKNIVSGYSRVRYFRLGKNQGQAEAKNYGLSKAKGKFITFLDDGDYYLSDHLSVRNEIIKKHKNIQIIHGGFKVLGSPYVPDKNDISKKIHIKFCVLGPTFVVRADMFNKVGKFKKLPYAEDAEWYDRARKLGCKIVKSKKTTYVYDRRSNKSSITKKFAKIKSL